MKKFDDFYNKRIVRLLVREPLKHGSYFLSHGGFHFVVFVVVGVLTGLWWYNNTHSSNTIYHNISLGIETKQPNPLAPDTLVTYAVDFELDSKEVLDSTDGKYNSRISVAFGYSPGVRDTTLLTLHSTPFLDDLHVNQDSVVRLNERLDTIETFCKTKQLNDSTTVVTVIPAKNAKHPLGGYIEGIQVINFYSNKLGIGNDDSYNFFIDFGFLPLVENTQHAFGYQGFRIKFGDLIIKNDFYHNRSKNILYNYIYPEPDIINNGFLLYYTKEAIEKVAKNHGIIIQAEDVDAKNNNNRKSIIYSVLVGTGIAFFLDILIQLIKELRNVNRVDDKRKKGVNNTET